VMVSRWAMTKAVRPSRRRSMLVLTTRSASLSGALVASSKIKAGVRGRSPRVALGRRRRDQPDSPMRVW